MIELSETQFYLFEGPSVVRIFSIFVDEGIQPLRDDSAVVGGRIKSTVRVQLFYSKILYVFKDLTTNILSLRGLYWFRIKVSFCIY